MWLQILLMLMTSTSFAQKCSLDYVFAMRSNEGWNKIPTLNQECVEILTLSDNNIQKIKDGDLDRFERLERLIIDNCKLETVGRMAFKRLGHLSYVDLSHNRLTYINNDIFLSNTKLTELVLNGNRLQHDKSSPILISPSIQTLKMRNCGIREVSSFMFSKLEKLVNLDLSKNDILSISDVAFNLKSLQDVCVDPHVFSKIRAKPVTVNFKYYDTTEDLCEFSNLRMTPDVKKESTTASSTPVISSQSSNPVPENQPTVRKISEVITPQTSGAITNSVYQIGSSEIFGSVTLENDVKVIIRENQPEKENNIFGVSIGNGEMYAIMAISMLVGSGLSYAVIRLCRRRRSNDSNRASEPLPRFVAAGPESASWVQPVVYKMVPQYELQYDNDMYERPLPPTGNRFIPPVHMPVPPYNPPLPPRPPRFSASSYPEYEYIESRQEDVIRPD